MKTTIDIPEEDLKDAMRLSGARTKKEAVTMAIRDFNRRRRMAALTCHSGSSETLATNEEIEAAERQETSDASGPG